MELPGWADGGGSSIQVFTDEWAFFLGQKGALRFGILAVKGPKRVDNLHVINAPKLDHWGDVIRRVSGFAPPNSPTPSGELVTVLP